MIPPIKETRLRSIRRYLTDRGPEGDLPNQPAVLESRAIALDEQMLAAFENKEDSLKESMMRSGMWGTGDGIQTFEMDRRALWAETMAEFLAPIAERSPATTPALAEFERRNPHLRQFLQDNPTGSMKVRFR